MIRKAAALFVISICALPVFVSAAASFASADVEIFDEGPSFVEWMFRPLVSGASWAYEKMRGLIGRALGSRTETAQTASVSLALNDNDLPDSPFDPPGPADTYDLIERADVPEERPQQVTVVNNNYTQPVVERTVREPVLISGVTESTLASRIAEAVSTLNARITASFIGAAQSARVENLSDVTLTRVTGLTDNDIPNTITAENYLPLTGGTVSGDLNLSGTLTAGTLSVSTLASSGALAAPYFTATSTSASSTFPNLNADNATITNATTTSFFSTLARVTDLVVDGVLSAASISYSNLLATSITATNATTSRMDAYDYIAVGRTSTTTIFGAATSTFGAGIRTSALDVTSTSASSTFANGINLTDGCFAIDGSCLSLGSGSSFAYLFPLSATTTLLNFNGGLTAFASTTIGNGTQAGGLTVAGGATTTGTAYVAGRVGIGNAPSSYLDVLNGDPSNVDSIYWRTGTQMSGILSNSEGTDAGVMIIKDGNNASVVRIDGKTGNANYIANAGNFGIGTTTPFARLSVAGNIFANGAVTGSNISATGTLSVSGNTSLARATTTNLAVTGLIGCDTIDTDANGNFFCGTDNGGPGSSFGESWHIRYGALVPTSSIGILVSASSTFTAGLNATAATSTTFFSSLARFTTGIIDSLTASVATITSLTASSIVATNATTTRTDALDYIAVGRTATTTIRGDGMASTIPFASTTALTVGSAAFFPSGIWNSSGRVGIGTSTPSRQLDVLGIGNFSQRALSGGISPKLNALYRPTITAPSELAGNSKYNAFGILAQLPSGKLAMIYREGSSHVGSGDYGIIRMRTSSDGGGNWSSPTTIASEASVDLRNVGGGVTPSGRLFVAYYRYFIDGGGTTANAYIYSDDEGATWSSPASITAADNNVYGRIIAIGGGQLLQPLYGGYKARIATSSDDGITWSTAVDVNVSSGDTNESSYVYLGGGQILGLVRINGAGSTVNERFHQVFSSDNGVTWTDQGKVTFDTWREDYAHPPTLLSFSGADGNLMVVAYYVNRGEGQLRAVYGRASELKIGITGWDATNKVTLVSGLSAGTSGYPGVIHPYDSQFGFGWYYREVSSSDTRIAFFTTPTSGSQYLGGKLAVGTSTPSSAMLQISSLTQTGSIPALGTISNTQLYLTHSDTRYGLLSGVLTTGDAWLQAQRTDGVATAYNLSLQPNGGNVGIGSTTPARTLSVQGTLGSTPIFYMGSPGTSQTLSMGTWYGGSSANSWIDSNGVLLLNPSGSNVGIGTTSPWRTLSVSGTAAFPALINDSTGYYVCVNTTTGQMSTSTTACGASSERFKENVIDLPYGIEELTQLRPVAFDYKDEYIKNADRQIGFIAEEVDSIAPELVARDSAGLIQGLDYPKFSALIVSAFKELYSLVSGLQESVARLSDRIVTSQLSAVNASFESLTTARLCVGTVCVTESQFMSVFGNIADSPSTPPMEQVPVTESTPAPMGDIMTPEDENAGADNDAPDVDSEESIVEAEPTTDDSASPEIDISDPAPATE